jgi:hypothetical protein
MEKKIIIITLIIFSNLVYSQIKLADKSIDSIVAKNSCQCYDFHFDKRNSHVIFSEITADEGVIPTKVKILADDNDGFNIIMNGDKEYVYFVIYDYKFTINGLIFYDLSFRYDDPKKSLQIIKFHIENANIICSKIKKGKLISPQKAEGIAKQNGFENISFQSIDDHYYGGKKLFLRSIEKNVWIFKEEKNNKIRTLILNAKNGKILEEYYQGK